MKVLIVEDEKRLAQALGQIMEEQKYSVDIVYDGEDGLDYALSGQYDVIVLDVMLPKKMVLLLSMSCAKQKFLRRF